MNDVVTPEALADGTTLLILKLKYLQTGHDRELYPFLSCLRDSTVCVPVKVQFSADDEMRVRSAREGEVVQNKDDVRMRPEYLTSSNGKRWFPVFSQPGQLPEQYMAQFSIVRLDVLQCLRMAHAASKLEGLVLDAFTRPAVLPFSVADLLPQIPSILQPES